jgi:hypothetical protein
VNTVFDDSPPHTVDSPRRDGVEGLDTEDPPTVVSVSDVHGYLGALRSALSTVGDHPDFDPIVTADEEGRLEWGGGEAYVLVFNGDLFDRGPDNDAVAALVSRLLRQAPDGHVRVTLGNHEMGILVPDRFRWHDWYSTARSDEERQTFCEYIRQGHVVAAYEGYRVAYAHAGHPDAYETRAVNDDLVAAADRLVEAVGTEEDEPTQQELIEAYPTVLGLGGRSGRGPGAGLAWLDLEFMPEDAPPQVVGHTRQTAPRQQGNVICQNTIRNNTFSDGGEAVVVETPDRLLALSRTPTQGVKTTEFSLSDAADPAE